MSDIQITIDPIAPLTKEQIADLSGNLDAIMQEIAWHDDYFSRVGVEMTRLAKLRGDIAVELLEHDTVIAILKNYDGIARSRVSLLKSLLGAFK